MIDGAKIIELATHEDGRGFFREIFRFREQFGETPVGQLSHSQVSEGVIKAWHGHVYQSQWNYVISGQIKVVLYDNRENSTTYKKIMEFISGDRVEPVAYFFTPGILHGYKCLRGPMQIVYVTTGIYDLEDEVRLNTEDLNMDFVW